MRSDDRDRRRGGGWVLAQIGLLAAIALAPRRVARLPAWPARGARASVAAGALCAAAGALLGLAGVRSLGTNLTIFPRPLPDGALVQRGAYGLVRHPIYSAVVLLALGWSLLRRSTPALLLTFVLGLFFDLKSRREERWLAQRFPEYAGYRARVRKLIPLIY